MVILYLYHLFSLCLDLFHLIKLLQRWRLFFIVLQILDFFLPDLSYDLQIILIIDGQRVMNKFQLPLPCPISLFNQIYFELPHFSFLTCHCNFLRSF